MKTRRTVPRHRAVAILGAVALFCVAAFLGTVYAVMYLMPGASVATRPEESGTHRSTRPRPLSREAAGRRHVPARAAGTSDPVPVAPPPAAATTAHARRASRRQERSTPEALAAQARRVVAAFESRLAGEETDPSWASAAQAKIAEHVAQAALEGGTLLSTRCRATLCRLEFTFESVAQRDDARSELPLMVPWDGAAAMFADADDPTRVLIFAARENTELRPPRGS